MPALRPVALVRGANDVASAVAVRLAQAGYAVLLAEGPTPAVTRRGQSFADAAFDGIATLEGVPCRRVDDVAAWRQGGAHDLAYCSRPLTELLTRLEPELLVDARMRKRTVPEDQRGLAPLVIGLGPSFTAGSNSGGNCDLAVETGWGDDLGRVVETGPTRMMAGEPRPIGGWGRERYIYAPTAGTFRTTLDIGDAVGEGQIVARIDDTLVAAPKTGILRGLVRHGVAVAAGAKCVEVVPAGSRVTGLAERPARIAAGVLEATLRHSVPPPLARAAIAGVVRNTLSGDLPLFATTLGFDRREYRAMATACLPGEVPEPDWPAGAYVLCAVQSPALFAPLAHLLLEHRAPALAERPARWLAHALAAAGFGSRHLWQDLGLAGRAEVSRLLHLCFPALAARNTADLKWKRFLFLSLGEALGRPGLMPPDCHACDHAAACLAAPLPNDYVDQASNAVGGSSP